MKYLVLVTDGAADYPIEELGGATPLEKANKPNIDALAKKAFCGTVSNVPEGMVPESDTANIAIMSYDPKIYSKGRSPLEAVSMGLTMTPTQTAFRTNVVTMGDEEGYENKTMIDHSADEITTAEADELIKAIDAELGDELKKFYTGVSYRHCLLWENAPENVEFMRPHDILGQKVTEYLPPEPFLTLQKKSWDILTNHPVNKARVERGLRPANSIWLWSPGKKPALPNFKEKWGVEASVISAVDLIKGIGLCAGMESIDVEGVTGNVHTNYKGKADSAIDAFKRGKEFVYIHVEAPDECGHRAELENKILSVELIDEKILKPVYEYLVSTGEDFKILILPDHPTPICTRTHAMDPGPFVLYSSNEEQEGAESFSEKAMEGKTYIPDGSTLLSYMIKE
ncbi:MAG: cofactor-independent phosphoglycerate mutase [Clostridia bacterium]|nr:cofactor-independent phosphoglycerate mutase [Clostridia bacterium]